MKRHVADVGWLRDIEESRSYTIMSTAGLSTFSAWLVGYYSTLMAPRATTARYTVRTRHSQREGPRSSPRGPHASAAAAAGTRHPVGAPPPPHPHVHAAAGGGGGGARAQPLTAQPAGLTPPTRIAIMGRDASAFTAE